MALGLGYGTSRLGDLGFEEIASDLVSPEPRGRFEPDFQGHEPYQPQMPDSRILSKPRIPLDFPISLS